MKASIILFFGILAISMLSAQIVEEKSYEAADQLQLVPLEVTGCSFVWVNKKDHEIVVYDLNHEERRRFSYPDTAFGDAGLYEVVHLSEQLFDLDPKIEFALAGRDRHGKGRIIIVNEDGIVLLDEQDIRRDAIYRVSLPNAISRVSHPNAIDHVDGRDAINRVSTAIYPAAGGARMVIPYDDGSSKVFRLPGSWVPTYCGDWEQMRVESLKGAKTITQRIDTIYLDGRKVLYQRDTLVMTPTEYEAIQKEKNTAISLHELSGDQLQPGMRLALPKVEFERGRAALVKGSTTDLKRLLELMKAHPTMEVRLEGHTDQRLDDLSSVGNNMQLSLRRVAAVRNYLVKKGIDGNRIKTKGFGGKRPIASNEEEESRRHNRRVEVYIISL